MSQVVELPLAEREEVRAVTYCGFWIFALRPEWWQLDRARRLEATREAEKLLLEPGSVRLRAAYSLAGFRSDADLMLWFLAEDPAALQEALSALRRTELGSWLAPRETYLGLTSGSQYSSDHQPAFVKGEAPRLYASVYPFAKSPEWYLLPFEKRRDLMAEHGRVGLQFPVATNTVQTFGLGDAEFIVALEADDLAGLVRCVEALRKVEVRRYTTIETPIFLGRRRTPAELLAELT